MPIVLNGDGTVSGISAGGLPDGCITAADLASGVGGKFSSYAVIAKVRAGNAGGFGTYTSGDWRTRDLDTEITDEDDIVSISSNQFTLQAGTYLINFGCTMYHIDKHAIRLQNITDGSTAGVGNPNASYTYSAQLFTTGVCRVTIASAKVFEVQGYPSSTYATSGMGYAVVNGSCHETRVEIYKES
tara:strand:- start:542 stop:1099 length:558 start_codon:yes stop_codon:yes gene_type:complete